MAGFSTRRRATVAIAALAAVAGLSACAAKSGQASGNPTATGAGQIGGAPTPTDTPPSPTKTTTSPAAPYYPKDAKAYALEWIQAWSKKDYNRLDGLGQLASTTQAKTYIDSGGAPNSGWHYIMCDGAAGTTHCTYRNDNGDEAVVALQNQQLGHEHAVTESPLDRTE